MALAADAAAWVCTTWLSVTGDASTGVSVGWDGSAGASTAGVPAAGVSGVGAGTTGASTTGAGVSTGFFLKKLNIRKWAFGLARILTEQVAGGRSGAAGAPLLNVACNGMQVE